MNIVKPYTAVLCSLLFLLVAAVDAARAGDYVDGRLGQGVVLDGKSQSIKIPHYAGLKPDKAITLSAWIKPAKIREDWWWQEIYRKEDGKARSLLAPDFVSFADFAPTQRISNGWPPNFTKSVYKPKTHV